MQVDEKITPAENNILITGLYIVITFVKNKPFQILLFEFYMSLLLY